MVTVMARSTVVRPVLVIFVFLGFEVKNTLQDHQYIEEEAVDVYGSTFGQTLDRKYGETSDGTLNGGKTVG